MRGAYVKGQNITPEQAIEHKLQVLKDFCIVNGGNEDEYRKVLSFAIRNEPNTHHDIVLDRVAKRLIAEKMFEFD